MAAILGEHSFVGGIGERGVELRNHPEVLQCTQIVGRFQPVVVRRDFRGQPSVKLRQGNDAHRLREIRVARRAHEQPIGFATGFARELPDPRPLALAVAERARAGARSLVQRALLAAVADAEGVADVRARAAFLEPEPTLTRPPALVNEPAPVQIVDMAAPAAADEPNRNHRLALAVFVAEPAPVQVVPSHQSAATPLRVAGRGSGVLDNEPGREDACADGRGLAGVFLVARRRPQFKRGEVQQPPQLGGKARLVHLFPTQVGPVLKAGDNDRVVGKVDHRSWPVGRDQLALANYVVGHRVPTGCPDLRGS